jgi:hypothetical protein
MKTSSVVGSFVALVIGGAAWYWIGIQAPPLAQNLTIAIDGQPVTLIDGRAETAAAPGSASKVVTQYFGNQALGDLNGDGATDVAFIITQSSGGSGTFYYAVVALHTTSGYVGTSAVLLGDRIAPQTTEVNEGQLVVNYADRAAGDPMTAQPSVGVTKHLQVQGTMLVEAPRVAGAGERCGGNMTTASVCATGLHCAPTPGSHLPFGDVGGTCVHN